MNVTMQLTNEHKKKISSIIGRDLPDVDLSMDGSLPCPGMDNPIFTVYEPTIHSHSHPHVADFYWDDMPYDLSLEIVNHCIYQVLVASSYVLKKKIE